MGNSVSSTSSLDKSILPNVIDHIASQYIFTSNFKSLTRLYDDKYCDKLVVLTSDIIQKNFFLGKNLYNLFDFKL